MVLRRTLLAVTMLAALGGAAQAAPLLDGATVQVAYLYPNTGSVYAGPSNVVVGVGTELANFASFVDIDLSDTSILITTRRGYPGNAVPFDGLRFTDILSAIPGWTAALNVGGTTYFGLLPAAVTYDANNVWVNLIVPAGGGNAGDTIRIDLAPVSVPEPASLVLLTMGGLAAIARQRRRKQQS